MPKLIDVTVADLADWTKGPLSGILAELNSAWGSEDSRCGTVFISNCDGLGEIRISLRFPLFVDGPKILDSKNSMDLYGLVNS